tara:strand:+ start:111756 stop:112190 length:435 start_codon:yes stop_codon:yes gene_type:complete
MDATILVWGFIGLTGSTLIGAISVSVYTLNKLKRLSVGLDAVRLEQDVSDNKFKQATNSITHMGKRILGLESDIKNLNEKSKVREQQAQHKSQQQSSHFGSGHYHQARKIVDLGGNESDLVQDCGLTRIEAQMIKVLQSKNKAS